MKTLPRPRHRRRGVAYATIILCSLLLVISYNMYCLARLRVTRLRIVVPELPHKLNGVRIVHLSDFHLGQVGTLTRIVLQAFDEARRFQPHLVALTGDYVDAPFTWQHAQLLQRLPRGVPTVAVLGNHDYARGPKHVAQTVVALESAGVIVLKNQAAKVKIRDESPWIVGLDDPFTLRSDTDQAFAMLPAQERPLLVLAHAPVTTSLDHPDTGYLILCGHTHGGQIRILPSGNVPAKRLLRWIAGEKGNRQDPDFYRGIHRLGAGTLIVSEGLGVSLLPIRFRTRPQLILVEIIASCD